MIFPLCGPSCSGKSTALNKVMRQLILIQPLESVTTRAKRVTDTVPGEYRYVDDAEFDRLVAHGELLWDIEAHGNRYGTRKAAVDQALERGIYVPLLTPDSLRTLHCYALEQGKQHRVQPMYLCIDNEWKLRERFLVRGDSPADVERRIADCRSWNDQARLLGVRLRWIDAEQHADEVAAAVMRHILNPRIDKTYPSP